MQITTQEVEKTLEKMETIEEPIIVKRKNKEDVIIISLQEYKEKMLKKDIIEKLQKSEEEIKNGKGINADIVFKELRDKYEY